METRKKFTEITEEAQKNLLAYDWPGNVRELANIIERAVVLGSGPDVALEDLPGIIVAQETGAAHDDLSYHGAVNAARREVVLKALTRAQGNRAAAAKALGLNAKYFLKLIKSLRIK